MKRHFLGLASRQYAEKLTLGSVVRLHLNQALFRIGAKSDLDWAAVAGLELPDSYYAGLGELYAAKRTLFTSILAKTGLKFTEPQGAYYSLLDISPLGFKTDTEAAEWLIKEIGVAGVPGSSFFREPEHRYVRFHFAKKEETLRAAGEKLGRIKR